MNRIKHTLAAILFAAASLALGDAAQAANIVTYNFNQANPPHYLATAFQTRLAPPGSGWGVTASTG